MDLVVGGGVSVADGGAVQSYGKCRAAWVPSPKKERTMGCVM